jgi:hypothetical protein
MFIVLGIALVVLGFWLWFKPVDHTKPAPDGAECPQPADCFVKVDDAPEILLSTIVVLGVLLLVIGINDRRISKLTGPGDISVEMEAAGQKAKEKAGEKADSKNATDAQKEAARLLAEQQARELVLQQVAAGKRPTVRDIEQLAELASDAAVGKTVGNPAFQ